MAKPTRQMTQADYAAERKRVDEFLAAKKAEQRKGYKQPKKDYPFGVAALGSIHSGFFDLYDALRGKPQTGGR